MKKTDERNDSHDEIVICYNNDRMSTCRKIRQVRMEEERLAARKFPCYKLGMIISQDYRVKYFISTVKKYEKTPFRQEQNQVFNRYTEHHQRLGDASK